MSDDLRPVDGTGCAVLAAVVGVLILFWVIAIRIAVTGGLW